MQTTRAAGAPRSALDRSTRPLILDLLAWLSAGPRAYAEVMEVWRTSCPRLPIWEDAVDAGLVIRRAPPSEPAFVELTPAGRALLAETRSAA
jgi:D-3-phosphoglycerate dehydrogenase